MVTYASKNKLYAEAQELADKILIVPEPQRAAKKSHNMRFVVNIYCLLIFLFVT
jgi:hypothetical protein